MKRLKGYKLFEDGEMTKFGVNFHGGMRHQLLLCNGKVYWLVHWFCNYLLLILFIYSFKDFRIKTPWKSGMEDFVTRVSSLQRLTFLTKKSVFYVAALRPIFSFVTASYIFFCNSFTSCIYNKIFIDT